MVERWSRGRSNAGGSIVRSVSRFLFLVSAEPQPHIHLYCPVMLVSRTEASVQKGRKQIRRWGGSGLRSFHTVRSWLCMTFLYSLRVAEERRICGGEVWASICRQQVVGVFFMFV